MKIEVLIGEELRTAALEFPTAEFVTVDGCCPLCKADPFHVSGKAGTTHKERDSIKQEAVCRSCDKVIGHVRVTFDTIFGIEEDERVLNGRCRVY